MHEQIVILAAGNGSRMRSKLPKVMYEVAGRSMLERVVRACSTVTDDLILVYSDHIKDYLDGLARCKLAKQDVQLGTAHAVAAALHFIHPQKYVCVVYADIPLITPKTIARLFTTLRAKALDILVLSFECHESNQYGRIVTDENGKFSAIVETRLATPEQLAITICNSGIYAFAPGVLDRYLPYCLERNPALPQKELYLTDIVEFCVKGGGKVDHLILDNANDVVGVNTIEELAKANQLALWV